MFLGQVVAQLAIEHRLDAGRAALIALFFGGLWGFTFIEKAGDYLNRLLERRSQAS